MISAGSILISTPTIGDPNFEKVVIFITESNEKGAMGFIINESFPRTLNELIEFKNVKTFPLHDGGPVEREHLYFIHQRPDLIEGGIPVINSIYMGGDFKQAITHLNNNTLQISDMKLFIGYCGWDPKQLENEIAEGCWLLADVLTQTVFTETNKLWEIIYQTKNN
jgi:putative transcriptional regulator